MDAPAMTAGEGRVAAPRQGVVRTAVVMTITAVVITAVAFIANQPPSGAGGVTSVTLTGATTGEPPTVGQPAPDFQAATVDGRTISLSDFKGRPVWLTFGATWCQPCRAENPDIEAVYERSKADGLVVIAIFITEDASTVRDYADRVGLTYEKIPDPATTIASRYRILGIPSHFFIDRDGILRELRIGALDQAGMERAIEGIQP
jgi:cytochrome c biogenesis protein CcmG/thiol:disulfide interchange protein DsbE